ncbi:Hypothetical Protein FCC1311_090172 [Hondaea fermentalgiana]|uniref:Fungal lipase-type domain-containing protein n=1 Tax=Hondaea fermentalgiana TaxID=2315210 RepID=A0A2R5GPI9_9STRA|nr:Hypothetical Protein FCC1311_090172 [Hondaea fermentalgiana]|eukprot:GBG32792.1 Hypothetical Protein FCC1311_090172 [Hondaea fermentalgiana]
MGEEDEGYGRRPRVELQDHFTLGTAITHLRFRDARVQVIQEKNHQIVIEDDIDEDDYPVVRLSVKKSNVGNFGLSFLRVIYTVGAIVLLGFVFAGAIDVILHVFLSIVANLQPREGEDGNMGFGIIELLAVPTFIHSLANAITLAFGFVADIWDGFVFFRYITHRSVVASEWFAWAAFVLCPLLALSSCILSGREDWWHVTALTLFFAYLVLYSIYSLAVLFYECKAAVRIFRSCANPRPVSDSGCLGSLKFLLEMCKVRVRFALSIYQHHLYSSANENLSGAVEMKDANEIDENEKIDTNTKQNPERIHMTWWSKLLSCGGNCVGLYERVSPPKRIWSLVESLEAVPFFTRSSWTLGGLCCASTSRATVSIISGQGALTSAQWISSALCIMLTIALLALTIVAVLWYFELGVGSWVLVLVVLAIIVMPRLFRALKTLFEVLKKSTGLCPPAEYAATGSRRLNDTHEGASTLNIVKASDRDDHERDSGYSRHGTEADVEGEYDAVETRDENARNHHPNSDNHEEEANTIYYQRWETVRLARPKSAVVIVLLALQVILFYVLPWAALMASENYPLGILFFFLGSISAIRFFFSPRMMLREYGTKAMSAVGRNPKDQMRLDILLTRISRKSVRVCFVLLLTLASIIAFALLVASAINEANADVINGTNSSSDEIIFLNDFEFAVPPPPRDLYYPTCRLNANAQAADVTTGPLGLADMAFLSHLAYVRAPNVQAQLDSWFGSDVAVFQRDFSEAFLAESTSPVSYYLVSFPDYSLEVVTARGTVTAQDAFVDLQLWLSALLFQAVRAVMPFGDLLTTIIPNLVDYISTVEAANIERVSYYRELTDFVETASSLRNESRFLITGHSLGGGLAIITGAQLKILTVAISGVNAMLSRHTFDPPVLEDNLNQYVFNVVPDRDPIPRVDDLARLYQRVECNASENSIFACHTILRTLCEISYRCGGRPPLCECTTEYGYPEPTSNGSRTFAEACETTS